MSRYPNAYIIGRTVEPGRVATVTVLCPRCGDRHTHGDSLGHRAAHCAASWARPNNGYVLTELPAGTGVPPAPALSCAGCDRVIGKAAGHFVDDVGRVLCGRCRNKPTQRAHAELYPECVEPFCRVREHAKASGTRAGAAAALGLWPRPKPIT